MSQIRISPDQMRVRANELNNHSGEVEQLIATLTMLRENLLTEWEGQASQGFSNQFDEVRPSFTQMQQILSEMSQQLNQAAAAMEQLDADISSGMGAR